MGVIFYFSACSAAESSEQSDSILDILLKIFGENTFTVFIVRKCAHMLEFTGLSFLLGWAWYFTKDRVCPLHAVIITSLYAVTDEVHQLFSDGRSCELRDWAIDTLGAIIGIIAFIILFAVIKAIKNKANANKNTKMEKNK